MLENIEEKKLRKTVKIESRNVVKTDTTSLCLLKCGREFAGNLHLHGIAWRSGCIDAFVGSIIVHKDGFVKLGGC